METSKGSGGAGAGISSREQLLSSALALPLRKSCPSDGRGGGGRAGPAFGLSYKRLFQTEKSPRRQEGEPGPRARAPREQLWAFLPGQGRPMRPRRSAPRP